MTNSGISKSGYKALIFALNDSDNLRSASSMSGAVRCPTGDSCHYCFGQAVFVFESAEVSSPEPDDAAAAAVAATDGGSSKKKTRLSKRQRAKMKAASAS